MTTVKELREWLKRFPDDTEVEFAVQAPSRGYESYGPVNFISPELDDSNGGDGWEFSDFRNNQFVKPSDPMFGKTYLNIGESY